jgi:hypothetical protein
MWTFNTFIILCVCGVDYFVAACIAFLVFVHGCSVSVRTTKRNNRCAAKTCNCN